MQTHYTLNLDVELSFYELNFTQNKLFKQI